MLLPELYALQDRYGWLPEAELRRLAERLSIPLRRVFEIVGSYPLFRIDKPPPRVLVRVCHDPVCQLHGSVELRESLKQIAVELGEQQVEVETTGCLGQCDRAPAVSINHHTLRGLDPTELRRLVRSVAAGERLSPQRADNSPLDWQIDPYRGQPGYEALRRFLQAPDPVSVLRELELANLCGSGGLGSLIAVKWQAVRDAAGTEKVVIANAHGGEPGSVKDRELLRRAPHVVLEGLLLAGLVTGATRGILFVRHDYLDELESLHAALEWAERSGLCGETASVLGRPFPVELFISPGHFVSGEQTALLELLEGRRGEPRVTPPDPTTHGLHGQPTLIQNVETLAWVP
ncbi:MAG: NAD(P)H-dependent oxidoreductase subunit E, partial [Planctomycetales bacterium]|nr:NAD(P)H-dependent oxidoreductase subunit E [Planctomycetales bacterium]